jgi:hypothetical protein
VAHLPAQQCVEPTAPGRVHGDVSRVGTLPSWLSEASGLVVSRRRGVLWTHEDSNNAAALVALRPNGEHVATVTVAGAGNYDWEDIVRLDSGDRSLLAVCDVGDNDRNRSSCVIHFLSEPDPALGNQTVAPLASIRFRYDDGPHDVEAVAFDGNRLLLLTKRDSPPVLFELPLDVSPGLHVARRLGTVSSIPPPPISVWRERGENWKNQPTAMDIDPSGHRLVVLTYTQLCLYQRRHGESWLQALQRRPEMLPLPLGQPQAEAVGFSADGRSVYLTSEGRGSPIHRVDIGRDPATRAGQTAHR